MVKYMLIYLEMLMLIYRINYAGNFPDWRIYTIYVESLGKKRGFSFSDVTHNSQDFLFIDGNDQNLVVTQVATL